jgi:phospholipase C
MADWEAVNGFKFDNGSIFEALANKGLDAPWRIYGGKSEPILGSIPCVAALHHITALDCHHFEKFAEDIQQDYPYFYTFIEPNYGDISNSSYVGGQSQHPRDDVRYGEQLIKDIYESIRNSPLWGNSLLIITYDEHGGFYDHVIPPKTIAPGGPNKYSLHGFDFTQLGVRVPAVVISPYIPKNIIDHTEYDHSSIPATLEALTDLAPLTERDAAAHNLTALLSLAEARTDTPETLPMPANDNAVVGDKIALEPENNPHKLIGAGNLPAFLFTAAKLDTGISKTASKATVFANARSIQTHGDVRKYLEIVATKLATIHPPKM